MPKIIGNTTATPNPRPDWNQTDETKADYIKNKPMETIDCGTINTNLPDVLNMDIEPGFYHIKWKVADSDIDQYTHALLWNKGDEWLGYFLFDGKDIWAIGDYFDNKWTLFSVCQEDLEFAINDVKYSLDAIYDVMLDLVTYNEFVELEDYVRPEISYLNDAVTILNTDVNGLMQQIEYEAHFRGYLSTNAKIQSLEATPNDFAYSAESGTVWVYDIGEGWKNTGEVVPDQLTPASNTTPLINGTASKGTENAYARGDHRHPTDTTRLSVAEFNSFKESNASEITMIINETDRLGIGLDDVETQIGDISTALDTIISLQEQY